MSRKNQANWKDPIREVAHVRRIRKQLQDQPRNLGIFVWGIEACMRASELTSLRVEQIKNLRPGEMFVHIEPKTRHRRQVYLTNAMYETAQPLMEGRSKGWLFRSRKGEGALRTETINRLVQDWCSKAGLKGNYGSHTLRKTWGYMQRVHHERDWSVITKGYGHASPASTMPYLGIQETEVEEAFMQGLF
jgi:integrase